MSSRINLGDLKSQITKRVGTDRAERYFSYLNRLLSQKLSKPEFNKLCLLTLGQENLPLHNQLILSIFKNACEAKTPPPSAVDKNALKLPPSLVPVLPNGDLSPPSPRRPRTGARRIKDRPSPLGPNGIKAPHDEAVFRENGDLGLCDLKRPVQHQDDRMAEQPAKRSRMAEDQSLRLVNVVDVDGEREDSDQRNNLKPVAKGPLRAPLGIPFCPPSVGGARRPLNLATSTGPVNFNSNFGSGELCHTDDLRRQMERIAEAQGLTGVTVEGANLLNNALDAYLKRLIKSCTELVGARSARGQMKQPVYKQHPQVKPINGVWQGNHMHVQSGGLPLNGVHELTNRHSISLQDFRVAMELSPQQLGEDWPLQLEKISLCPFEE
ncbi:uncharacterized protein A4U43_C05F24400 [Asparagus officinalis]|uniref:Transcriptional coactivator Hfi1/Transcriptional adapter 1 n=1 Tax=Asparagus officinalis TaxID=4686 RepID=A0A5P1EUV9_ASPOF|nr:uncharacterized protein LOC109840420 [Asparagus officinalis]ONK69574.1 uncharacterized protein A4U43_C05F24400 [Asparagus officinalis]